MNILRYHIILCIFILSYNSFAGKIAGSLKDLSLACASEVIDRAKKENSFSEYLSVTSSTTGCFIVAPGSVLTTTSAEIFSKANLSQADSYARTALAQQKITEDEVAVLRSVLNASVESNLITSDFGNTENGLTADQLNFIVVLAATAQEN